MPRSFSPLIAANIAVFLLSAPLALRSLATTCCTVATHMSNSNDPEPPTVPCSFGYLAVCQTQAESDADCGNEPNGFEFPICVIYLATPGSMAWGLCSAGPPAWHWKLIHKDGDHCCWVDNDTFRDGTLYFDVLGPLINKCDGDFCGENDPGDCPKVRFPPQS